MPMPTIADDGIGRIMANIQEEAQDTTKEDLFEEMAEIEAEYGSVYTDEQRSLFELKAPSSLWYIVYDSMQRKNKFEHLLESIHSARNEAATNDEVKKKRLLEDYFKMKKLKNVT